MDNLSGLKRKTHAISGLWQLSLGAVEHLDSFRLLGEIFGCGFDGVLFPHKGEMQHLASDAYA